MTGNPRILNGENILINKWSSNWIFKCWRTKFTKISSRWIKKLNIRLKTETMKFPEENIGKKLLDIDLGNDFFLDMASKAQATKA